MGTVTFQKQTLRILSFFLIFLGFCLISPRLFSQRGDTVYVSATATPDSICAGASSQLLATVVGGTGPYTFSWIPVTGLNNPNIANPVASPTTTTQYHVNVVDAAFHSGSDSALVSIIPTPDSPGTINGPSVVCRDSTAGYSIQFVPGAISYSWTVPAGAQILSGQNTIAIVVQWGNTGGNISVIAGNQCGNSNPSVLAITINSPPSQPATIQGPALVCNAADVIYSVSTVPEANSYFWTVPPDAIILSGQYTDSVFVQWGANAGNITVVALNNCGESSPRNRAIGLETLPEPAGIITGNDTICSNYENYSYTIPAIPGATSYTWSFPVGMKITSGTGTSSVVVTISPAAISGSISVEGNNTCGSGTPGSKNISVKTCAGISEYKAGTGISVYPNPAEKVLNLTINSGQNQTELQIVDVNGQLILRKQLEIPSPEFIYKIDVSAFVRGVYFVKLVNSKRVVIRKIILQ